MGEESEYRYYSSGKLLITGEYLVLHGGLSLAVPTAAGQHLTVINRKQDDFLHWTSNVLSKAWFHCILDPGTFNIVETNMPDIAHRLNLLLRAASELKGQSGWLKGISAFSELGFDIEWGLGSSSSLISNIADWAGVDPFRLSGMTSRGSGYDVAAARANMPILYRKGISGQEIREVRFYPEFSDRLAFLYLGKKQNSSGSVKTFLDHTVVKEHQIGRISEISEKLTGPMSLMDYEDLLAEHERILSEILEKPRVKETFFPDYPGMVKSLGAWGGDFAQISLRSDLDSTREYFSNKGFSIVIPYTEMVKPLPDGQ